jgi:hypothetical protein
MVALHGFMDKRTCTSLVFCARMWILSALCVLDCSSSGHNGAPNNPGGSTSGGASGATGATGATSSSAGGTWSSDYSSASSSIGGATGGSRATGGAQATGGTIGTNGTSAGSCDDTNLVWKTANKTNFTSYPDPGSEECIKYNGCAYEGLFAACDQQESQSWVQAHDIVSVFPDFNALKLHDLCLKAGSKTMIVTVLDTCADSDCSGCCTTNKGTASELIDIESYTDQRFGVPDGPIQWADLGPTKGTGCN